ncbi:glycerophosphodiester phosphodiesterase family protein [Proteiniphilum sp. X52]|uniref:glycerophosphodiester phosphodiesterase family protein n=1 Tax=Proteiniphilum sp. X52 TaxID=2382159 RepID=UPI000F0A0D29|nr:glycerophosphodiester phosphodiesterase family protein [Proteiniphilum sp. X52]RNC65749.1 hypothetical protein D7D25_06300 [Proteiniphilum sp. X52]
MKPLKTGLFLFLYLLLSCHNSDLDEMKSFLTIQPADSIVNLDAGASSIFYTVTSDKSIRAVSDNPDWCKPSLSNVTIANLKIAVSENEMFQNRKAIVSVKSGSENINISINQAGVQPLISVDQDFVFVRCPKLEFTLEITSNVRIEFELPEWITERKDNAWQKGKKKYNFTISTLPDEMSYREGVVRIKPENESAVNHLVLIPVIQRTTPKIIAHRGYWRVPDYPQNSLASLQRAFELDIYGSELDVWITKDGVVVLNHDPTINGINIENSTYSALQEVRLSNGEPIPTLADCIDIVKRQEKTKLIIEIKPHSTVINENRAVAGVLELVDRGGIADLVDYISFSQNICKNLIANNPRNRVAYLNGNLAPEALKAERYWGLDYSSGVLKTNTGWVQTAQNIGLKTNVWTVNTTADFEYFISMGVDFITTDYPQDLKEILLCWE